MRRVILVGWSAPIILAVAGCGAETRDDPSPAVADVAVPITLWFSGDAAAAKRRGLQLHDHACGATVQVVSDAIPPIDSLLEAERVVEFDAQGRPVRRWRIPVDAWIAGVRDSLLLVPLPPRGAAGGGGPTQLLAIDPSGRLSRQPYRAPEDAPTLACPVLPEFQGSAFLRCFQHRDQLSGAPRRLAYEGPCT